MIICSESTSQLPFQLKSPSSKFKCSIARYRQRGCTLGDNVVNLVLRYNGRVDNIAIDADNGSKQESMHGPDGRHLIPVDRRMGERVMKSFLNACGLKGPLQFVVESEGAEGGELRPLHQPFALIGRDPRADLVLDHARVSRRHVYFQVIEGRAFWVDLESRTGTRADGDLRKSGWLADGQTLRVGPYAIQRFVIDNQTGNDRPQVKPALVAPFVAVAYNHAPLPEVALEFLNGPSQAMAWPVRRVMSLIGSAGGCKFRLTDASVSRFHASFLSTSAGLWIVDLLGHGGITINEAPVRFSQLADGDLLGIGRYQIRVRCRLRGQGSSSRVPDRSFTKAFTRLSRPERVSNELKSADWTATALPSVPGTEVANLAQFPMAIPAHSSLSNAEVIASAPTFPLKLASSDVTESLLVPLVNQFGLMQQQMFDQFQQAMGMMMQMFGTMHREQMETIRAELDRLHDLTEEVHALNKELANRTQERSPTVSSASAIAPRDLVKSVTTEPSASAKAKASGASSDPKVAQADATSVIELPSFTSSVAEQQLSSGTGVYNSPPPSSKLPAAHTSPGEFQESNLRSQGKTDATNAPVDSEQDSIVWLHQRIMILQRERETRWQKILKLLPGVS
jgi:pSer/pThr/pTyr-binding forkhead associated (FHA) protein